MGEDPRYDGDNLVLLCGKLSSPTVEVRYSAGGFDANEAKHAPGIDCVSNAASSHT